LSSLPFVAAPSDFVDRINDDSPAVRRGTGRRRPNRHAANPGTCPAGSV